jgi:hypothetical protein
MTNRKTSKKITDKLLKNLGPLELLAIDIPLLSYVENGIAEAVLGDELEAARQVVAEFELPDGHFENACEAF